MNYKFYIQRYSYVYWDETKKDYVTVPKSQMYDIEENFSCRYVRVEGLSDDGNVKNVYTEEYAETEELRVYSPKTILHKNNEISLTLLFLANNNTNPYDVQDNERRFFEFIKGRKVEFHDNFRNRWVSLLLLNKPETVGEVLYGGSRYRQVKYTFKNIYGSSYTESKIE